MAKSNRRANIEDLVKITSDLIDQVKVLVAAVDDLRCEVEWWARNAADPWQAPHTGLQHSGRRAAGTTEAEVGDDEIRDEKQIPASLECNNEEPPANPLGTQATWLSAKDRLSALESTLKSGPPGAWPDDADESEPPELPTGCIVEVDEELWMSVIDMRPAHVFRMGCCCEEGIGAPYLFAWEAENGYFLRELTEAEAVALQQACLATQDETTAAAAPIAPAETATTQLGLWQE